MTHKSLLTRFSEAIDQHRAERAEGSQTHSAARVTNVRHWIPVAVNVMLVFLLVGVFWAQSVGAISFGAAQVGTSTGTIAYQGRLADAAGNPLTQTVNMVFRLYATAEGGTPLWEEQWTASNGVQVSDGLFNVMLGSLTPIPQAVVTANDPLFLGISVGTDGEMAPRVQLGSVPFAVQALTVPDGSITQEKLAPDVTFVPPDGSVTEAKLADGAVTQGKAPTLIKSLSTANLIIHRGNQVFQGTDDMAYVTINFSPCFPNGVTSFIAQNGDWNANPVQVVGHEGATACSVDVKMSTASGNHMRINWIAIGY